MKNILSLVSQPGLLDYAQLADESQFPEIHAVLDRRIIEVQAELKRLFAQPVGQATFNSTVEEVMNMDADLVALYMFIDHLNSVLSSEKTRAIVQAIQPKLVKLGNEVVLSTQLYALLTTVKKKGGLTADQQRSLELFMRDMRIEGVAASPAARKRLAKINNLLAKLCEKFSNNVLDSRKQFFYHIPTDAAFPLLPDSDRHPAQEEAKARGFESGFVFTLNPPSYSALMKYCTDRTVRKLFYEKSSTVSSYGKLDNRPLIIEILKLRNEKAQLLGFKTFADYMLQTRSAPSVSAILREIRGVNKVAKKAGAKEVNELARFAQLKKLEEWDISFYSEQYRRKNFAINEAQVREYFPLKAVFEGLQLVNKKLFDITLKPIKKPLYHKDVQAYEVYRKGKLLGYYIADFFAHERKRGGAWCNDIRRGRMTKNGRVLPIMINVMNFPKPTKTTPSLLSIRDVETLFHEFGHALHMFLSATSYVNISGFSTELDFVEFPSQIFENWVWEPDVLKRFARHYRTGEPIPAALVKKLKKAKTFMGGYFVTRQNEFAMVDMTLHTAVPPPDTAAALERMVTTATSSMGVLKKPSFYKMYASFNHIFAGGYSAGYYGYLWAEILEADAFSYIKKKGTLSAAVGRAYAREVLEPGARLPGRVLFQNFVGRPPRIAPLLDKYGLRS
ncbi:M3 family metallopeptidase [Candidatus Gracilibacteria bacterium]|nr:M3 family metallopeptidase [Candidatus Gracilibacteria bacterium]